MKPSSSIPDLFAEQERRGELADDLEPALRARLDEEPARGARRAALDESDRDILRTYPPAQMAAAIEARARAGLRGKRTAIRLALAAGPALIAIALLGWWLLPAAPVPAGVGPGGPEVVRAKGSPRLEVHLSQGKGSAPLRDGDLMRAGALLQLRYFAGDYTHGCIVSIDGRGQLTVHFPDPAGAGTTLVPGRAVALPHAYELDDAPDVERFFFVYSHEAFPLKSVLEAIARLAPNGRGRLDLPAGLSYTEFTIRKPGRH